MRYRITFDFCDTKTEAAARLEAYRRTATSYQRKKYPGTFTPLRSSDGMEKKFVVWTSCRQG